MRISKNKNIKNIFKFYCTYDLKIRKVRFTKRNTLPKWRSKRNKSLMVSTTLAHTNGYQLPNKKGANITREYTLSRPQITKCWQRDSWNMQRYFHWFPINNALLPHSCKHSRIDWFINCAFYSFHRAVSYWREIVDKLFRLPTA